MNFIMTELTFNFFLFNFQANQILTKSYQKLMVSQFHGFRRICVFSSRIMNEYERKINIYEFESENSNLIA